MPKKPKVLTATLFCWVLPINREWVKKTSKSLAMPYSQYINDLIDRERKKK